MIEEIKNRIEVSKEVLDTLPKNNIKNQEKYDEILLQQKQIFERYKFEIIQEILKRKDTYMQLEDHVDIDITTKMKDMKKYLYLLNDYNSSYEKLSFDKILYKLNHFYKEELDEVNNNILSCIQIFKKIGIELTGNDFNYSPYTNRYMTALLENNEDIKDIFEEIYWQCPDLFIHIELNIKYLYYLNKKTFDRYVEVVRNNFISVLPSEKPLAYYKSLVTRYDDLTSRSLKLGLKKFMAKERNLKDYSESNIKKSYAFFTDEPYSDESVEEIIKMARSVKEYKEYVYFKPLIEDIKKLYEGKESYKGNLKKKLKEIQKKEKLVYKYNRRNKINKLNNLLKELDTLYEELDLDLFLEALYNNLNEESSIYDVLYLASSYFTYIVKYAIENKVVENDTKKVEDFIAIQDRLKAFVVNPYNTIFSNILMTDDRNIPFIICDRYKLSNLNINPEMLDEKADEIITNAEIIEVYNKVVSKITTEKIDFIISSTELLNK